MRRLVHGAPDRRRDEGRVSETWEVEGRTIRIEPTLVVNDFEVACEAAIAGSGSRGSPGWCAVTR